MSPRHAVFVASTAAFGLALPGDVPAADHGAEHVHTWQIGSGGPSPRETQVDLAPFTGTARTVTLAYDPAPAHDPVDRRALPTLPGWAIASRLLLSEMGTRRLLDPGDGLLEAIGILQTVHNRLDPTVWNPEGRTGVRAWPGCGADGTFRTCAHPDQYLGLRHPRALRPMHGQTDPATLLAALDVAVTAWWLVDQGAVADVTKGSTSFVHRCGAPAYGAPTTRCDGRDDPPDVPGARATTGPIAFKGPGRFDTGGGHYGLTTRATVDHAPAHLPDPGDYADLWRGLRDEPRDPVAALDDPS